MIVRLVLVTLLVVAACACKTPELPGVATPPAPRDAPADLRAGVAKADITPPPGLALFGHGPEGRVSVGMRLRLFCSAIVLTEGPEAIAIVPCDIAAPDLQLQRSVAKRLVAESLPFGGDRILLMATHTHAGPAHYLGPQRYSGSFSSYDPGFDENVREFLADRIAAAIKTAHARRVPACIGWGRAAVYGLTRNRSFGPFAANQKLPAAAVRALRDLELPYDAPMRAVDPTLLVMRVDEAIGDACDSADAPLGLFAVFGMHPTAVPNTNDLYHGDVFGFATRKVEEAVNGHVDARRALLGRQVVRDHETGCGKDRSGREVCGFVAGLANGIEGDVSPAVEYQSVREAKRLGHALAHRIVQVHLALEQDRSAMRRRGEDGPLLRVAYRELRWPGATVSGNQTLCPTPEIGTASGGGAADGLTRFRVFPEFNPGARLSRDVDADACHHPKIPIIGPDGHPRSDGVHFPALAPIALVRLGNAFLATAPAELTTVTGLRVRDAIERARPTGVSFTAVAGLTNAYVQYVATEDEYPFQQYEGASTLYGPRSAKFLEEQFACLAAWHTNPAAGHCNQAPVGAVDSIRYDPQPRIHRFQKVTEDVPESFAPRDLVAVPVIVDGECARRVQFSGIPHEYLQLRERFSVQILREDSSVADDDRGAAIELRYDFVSKSWTATWNPGFSETGRRYRFVVRGPRRLTSQLFELCEKNIPAADEVR